MAASGGLGVDGNTKHPDVSVQRVARLHDQRLHTGPNTSARIRLDNRPLILIARGWMPLPDTFANRGQLHRHGRRLQGRRVRGHPRAVVA